MKLIIHTDGGARGNPGPAAVGVVIERQEESKVESQKSKVLITEFGKRIGETTNNVAEYTAVVEALKEVKSRKSKVESRIPENIETQFYLDSNLVVQQLNGNFKIKDANLQKLAFEVRVLEKECGGVVTYEYVPREENTRADFFVNKALDQQSDNTTKQQYDKTTK